MRQASQAWCCCLNEVKGGDVKFLSYYGMQEGETVIRVTLPRTINDPVIAFVLCLFPSSGLVKLHHSQASAGNGVVRFFDVWLIE